MARHIKIQKGGRRIAIRSNRKKPARRSNPQPNKAEIRVILANFRKGEEFLDEALQF